MQISTQQLDGDITRIMLDGRLDIAGAAAIDLKMNLIAGTARKLMIDMQNVTFLGSMGLSAIVIPSRAVHSRGGRVVLFAPNNLVESVLRTSGINGLLPVYHDFAAAIAALQ